MATSSDNELIIPLDLEQSISNFDLSILDSVPSEEFSTVDSFQILGSNISVSSTSAISKIDSLLKRVTRIEEFLGVYQIAIMSVRGGGLGRRQSLLHLLLLHETYLSHKSFKKPKRQYIRSLKNCLM